MMHALSSARGAAARFRCARPLRGGVALLGLLWLGACSSAGSEGGFWRFGGASTGASQAVAVAPSTDPLVVFASQAQPGSSSRIMLADGTPASVRLVRAYNAASGRQCREVLVGIGSVERSRLVCDAGNGGWMEARPLLRGGGAGRP